MPKNIIVRWCANNEGSKTRPYVYKQGVSTHLGGYPRYMEKYDCKLTRKDPLNGLIGTEHVPEGRGFENNWKLAEGEKLACSNP